MYCVTILSVLCIVILDNGGAFWLGLAVFYLSAGFFVVFFTASFMRLSKYEKCPQLWAGLGRAVNNLCAFWMGPMSVALLRSDREVLRTGTLLVLLVLISLPFSSIPMPQRWEMRPGRAGKTSGSLRGTKSGGWKRLQKIFP